MPLLFLLAVLAWPLLEFGVVYAVASQVGLGWTLLALAVASLSGVVIMRWAGLRAYREADEVLRTGEAPSRGVLDTLMLLAGGLALALPGFLTATLGLVLALPFTRPALRWAFRRWTDRRLARMRATVVDAEVVDVTEPGGPARGASPRLVQGRVVDDED